MKLINFEKKEENSEKTLNKKKVALTISVIIIICIMIVLSSIYITNIAFRNFIDTNIFKKNITENNATVIQIEKEKNPYFYAFDKYVVKLEENTLDSILIPSYPSTCVTKGSYLDELILSFKS